MVKNKRNSVLFYVKSYKFNSIFIKNFLMILYLIILPLSVLTIAVYDNNRRITEDEIIELNMKAVNKNRDIIDTILSETNRIASWLPLQPDIQFFFLNESMKDFPEERRRSIQNTIKSFTIINEYINSIYFYSEKSNFIVSNIGISNFEKFLDNNWYSSYNQNKDKDVWFEFRKQHKSRYGYPYVISLIKPVKLWGSKNVGTIVINIDAYKLSKMLDSLDMGEYSNVFILDKDSKIVYNDKISIVGKNIQEIDLFKEQIIESEQSYIVKNKSIISVTESKYNDWKYISVLPLEYYNQNLSRVKKFMNIFILFSIIMAVVISFFISMKVFKPVKDIISVINNPSDWMKSEDTKVMKKHNEFLFIARTILKSFDSNKKMEEELSYNIDMLEKAQKVALQSQINPHFLFNTLETIRFMALKLTNSDNKVSNAITTLSQLLRLSLQNSDKLIPISKEIDYVKLYIEIQKLRYQDKFNVIWDIDENIMNVYIVNLSIQPLVENSIYHGIKPKDTNGVIKIKGYIKDNNIIIEVQDDGVGMSEQKAYELNQQMRNEKNIKHENIGLANVNLRIKLIFGEQYGLYIDNDCQTGSRIKLLIPYTKSICC